MNNGGLPSIGDLAGCGGPLSNCGGVNQDPWNEDLLGPKVKSPERFVMHANPFAIRSKGQSFGGCMEQHASIYSVAGVLDLASFVFSQLVKSQRKNRVNPAGTSRWDETGEA